MSYEAWGEPDDSPFEAAIEAGWIDPTDQTKALIDVMNERDRQVNEEGWSSEHDDFHVDESLAQAAACYALPDPELVTPGWPAGARTRPRLWPKNWAATWWKPQDRRRNLVRAAALLLAEIERIDRADLMGGPNHG
ncbi:hypothetical protein D5400_17115 [Georhizobium profundi]|uniref:Uncharacterized protein n=1 Tax=Georhizobium profundi TaxID=2341112 RepID=A0A3Q8XQA2_9HYPH|nr:hypothetical protein [Georhizobium profundi]AZN72767.1 hypothetical protein D5400_17115 [Georhizobium profundi]